MLLGRERRSVTEHVYDDDGRLVRSVTTHDALFTDDDLAAALERAEDRDARCPGCGQLREDAWVMQDTPDAQIKAMDRRFAAAEHECVACAKVDRARDRRGKADSPRPGIHTTVVDRS